MNRRSFFIICALILVAVNATGQTGLPGEGSTVKLIYSSDLYFPPDDPDDYFDLATLMTSPGIEVLGIVLDQQLFDRRPESEGTGAVPLRQMFEITGRRAPYSIGLRHPLRSIDDQGLYGFPPGRFDVNLEKDRNAFLAIMKSGLPVYWAACFGENNYETYWQADQRRMLESATTGLQNYFLHAFSKGTGKIGAAAGKATADPVEFLRRPLEKEETAKMYNMTRNMWSTVTFLDAAGLSIYRNERGEYAASREPVGDFTREVKPYLFKRLKVFIDDQGRVHPNKPGNVEVFIIHKEDVDEYRNALESILKKRFSGY